MIRMDHGEEVLQEVLDFVGPQDLAYQDVELGKGDALGQRVRRMLVHGDLPQHFNYGHEFLAQAWESFDDRQRVMLSQAIADHIQDEDARVRSGVIRFFQRAPSADDFGALAGALRDDHGAFQGVTDPIPGATGDLRMELARAVANHPLRMSSPDVLSLLRGEAQRPGMAGGVLAGLFDTDRDWVLANAREIVAHTPGAYTICLLNLALRKSECGAFIRKMRGVVPDEHAEAVVRER
jgi:hypothetical protein